MSVLRPYFLAVIAAPALLLASCATVNKVDDAQRLHEKGQEALQQNRLAEAIELFSQAIKLHPKLEASYYKRGVCRLTLVSKDQSKNPRLDLQEAIQDFTQSIALWPLNYDSFYNRGICHSTLAMYREAVKDFQAALRSSDPELLQRAHRKLGLIYQDEYQDMKTEALAHYGKYMELGGQDLDVAKRIKGLQEAASKDGGGR